MSALNAPSPAGVKLIMICVVLWTTFPSDDHQEAAKEASLLITATDYCWDLPASSVLVWPGISLVNTRNASFSAQMGSHAKICL